MTGAGDWPNGKINCRNHNCHTGTSISDIVMDRIVRQEPIVDIVYRHYVFGSMRRLSRLTGGVLNEVYLTETSRGDFVIRVNRVRRSIDEIERLSDFLSHLDRSGIPVDGLVRTAGGQVAVDNDGRLLSVHRYFPGTVYPTPADLTDSQTANMMGFLASYHSAASRYRSHESLAARDEPLAVIYTDDPDRLRERLESLPKTSRAAESAVNGAIHRLAGFFDSRLYKELERTWIHGDYRSCNVAFNGDRVCGLFDWDLLCSGPRLWDVVVVSGDMARTAGGSLSRQPETWRREFVGHLAAYRKEACRHGADITEPEVSSIPSLLIADTMLSGVFFALYLRRLPLKPGESADQRRQRSEKLLSASVDDLVTIESLIARGDTIISPNP